MASQSVDYALGAYAPHLDVLTSHELLNSVLWPAIPPRFNCTDSSIASTLRYVQKAHPLHRVILQVQQSRHRGLTSQQAMRFGKKSSSFALLVTSSNNNNHNNNNNKPTPSDWINSFFIKQYQGVVVNATSSTTSTQITTCRGFLY